MKKLLLAITCMLGFVTAVAQTTLDVAKATNIVGTYTAEVPEGTKKAAGHYQPLTSLTIENYNFTFSKGTSKNDVAYYEKPSFNQNTLPSIRLYSGNTMSIAAPVAVSAIEYTLAKGKSTDLSSKIEGTTITVTSSASVQITSIKVTTSATGEVKKAAGLSFPEAKYTVTIGDEFDNPELTKATTAAVTYASDKEEVATVDATTGAVTIIGVGTAKITATAAENDEYYGGSASYLLTVKEPAAQGSIYTGLVDNCDDWTFDHSNLPEGITYVWQWKVYNGSGYLNGSAYNKKAYAATAYAYTTLDFTKVEEATLTFDHAAKFQTTLKTDCKLVVRENGASDWTELTIPTWPEAGAWTFANSGEISLNAYAGKQIQIGFKYVSTDAGADTWEIKNFIINGKLSGVENVAIEAAEAGEVEYFNLQGVRVANPTKGLYIVRQGNKVTKVIL